jgi:exopolysaccharide production protein ExoY
MAHFDATVIMQENLVDPPLGGSLDLGRFHHWLSIVRPIIKRALDIILAAIIFFLVLPLFIFILLAIASTGLSPIYSHPRIGRSGRLKFRTMRRDADRILTELLRSDPESRLDWETHRKLRRDPRVTRLGKILRVTSLDEIPQLINVMAGHMSLVGPRPVTQEEFASFYSPPEAAAYKSIRPGLTGPWQISGRSEGSYSTRVMLDTRYAQRLSLRTDMTILLRTAKAVILQKGAW